MKRWKACIVAVVLMLAGPACVRGATVCGTLAERPGCCTGVSRGDSLVLQPLDLPADHDLASGAHCFHGVPPGQYDVALVSTRCNPFGCWPRHTPLIVAEGAGFVSFHVDMISPCTGSCDAVRVDVSDLVLCVNVALGRSPLDSCFACDRSLDDRVTIDELLQAVQNSIVGCPDPCGGPLSTVDH